MRDPISVVVFGAQGQVGRELCRRSPPGMCLHALGRLDGDITNADHIARAFRLYAPQVVINAAAYTAVDRAESDVEAAYAVNATGPALLAESCVHHGVPLLHISTDYVFPGDACRPYSEDAATGPNSVYGASKLAGEMAIRAVCPQHIILRTAWVFGACGQNFVKTMLRLGKDRPELRVVADQTGGPTPAAAIADVLLAVALRVCDDPPAPWGTYHFCGSEAVTWHGFAETILTEAHRLGLIPALPQVHSITTTEYPTPARRPAFSMLDCARLEARFGIKAADWRVGLVEVLNELMMAENVAPAP